MESKPPNGEIQPLASTSKRKRSTSQDEENITNEKEGNPSADENQSSNTEDVQNSPSQDEDKSNRVISRKRKFVFPGQDNVPAVKKNKKFYFISETMIKPRKTKIQKRAVITQSAQNVNPFEEQETRQPIYEKLYFTKVDQSGNDVLVQRSHLESDLFCIDEKRHSYEISKHTDLSYLIVDEIALEGLDGITLEAFWKRLRNAFPNNFSKRMSDTIWKSICANKHVNFFVLNKSRDKLTLCDRWKYVDLDSGTIIDTIANPKDLYPYKMINQGPIRGSCSTFETRKETNAIRKLTLARATATLDGKLVLVGDQILRNRALIHEEADPLDELNHIEYCLLERVGRARDSGELTHGKMSLQAVQSEPKSLFYNRKLLVQSGLIVNQTFFVKSLGSTQSINGGLVHLPRFYSRRVSKQVLIMDQLAQLLRKRPDYSMDFLEFRRIFGRSVAMIKLIKAPNFRKYFKILSFLYRQIYPNAPKGEWWIKSSQKERSVRVIKLADPFINITAACDKRDKIATPTSIAETPGHKVMNYECLRDVFLYILMSGKDGVTVQEIHDHLKTDYYTIRMAVKKLLARTVVTARKIETGRQQSFQFIATCTTNPEMEITLTPKEYELDPYVVLNVLKGYDKKLDDSVKMYSAKNDAVIIIDQDAEVSPHFTLTFDTFFCNAYLTDFNDSTTENVRIFDIINRGRDRLLLCASNLAVFYLPEWENLIMKRADFFKSLELFQSGFGKIVYDFLSSLKFTLTADNCIVFDLDYLISSGNRRCKLVPNYEHHISIERNYVNPHSDHFQFDFEGKLYLFKALFEPNRETCKVIENLRAIMKETCSDFETSEHKVTPVAESSPKGRPDVQVEDNTSDRFLGPNPILQVTERDRAGIITEIYTSTRPRKVIKSGTEYTSSDPLVTERFINRANIVLKALNRVKIVKDAGEIVKEIRTEEEREGYNKVMCYKTGLSILAHLVEEGFAKVIKVVLRRDNLIRSQVFICQPRLQLEHSFIKSTIEEMKTKLYVGSPGMSKVKPVKVHLQKDESIFTSSDVKDSILEFQAISRGSSLPVNFKRSKEVGRKYGFSPKFVRMRILHEFLYYLIHELPGRKPLDNWEVNELLDSSRMSTDGSEMTPPVYANEVSWRTFIHPLPIHKDWPKGWALACDIALRLPLSIFVQIYNVAIYLKELEEYLKHPVKKHYLIKYLPDNIRTVCLDKRKYFAQIYEIFCNLCHLGLMQLGPRSYKLKDQMFVYLNKRASLYDTTTSSPGYHTIEDKPYVKRSFEFVSRADADLYWSELWRICHNTPLGKRKVVDGEVVVIQDATIKPELIATLRPRTLKEAEDTDNGELPGDLKGAAGLDSSLWSYLRRNWMWKKLPQTAKNASFKTNKVAAGSAILYSELLKMKATGDKKVYLAKTKSKKTKKIKPLKRKSPKKSVIYRKIALPKPRNRAYYDSLDRTIMKRNRNSRIEWDENEDAILRFSRIAALFLCPQPRKKAIPYNVMRDVLHRVYAKSKNKSSQAYKRRLYFLIENDDSIKIMESNVESLLNDPVISKCLGQIHSRYKNSVKFVDAEIHVAFVYLVAYMLKFRREIEPLLLGYVATVDFFSDSYISLFELLLESADHNKNPKAFEAIESKEDVMKDTIKSILHVVLNQPRNNQERAFRLYHTYKQFPDELIKETVFELKASHFLTLNRGYLHKTVNIWPLKFSWLYQSVKCSTFTHPMYRATFSRLESLIDGELSGDDHQGNFLAFNEIATYFEDFDLIFDIPEMEIILNTEIEDHGEVIEELAKRFLLYLEKIYENSSRNESLLSQDKKELKSADSNEEGRTIDEVKNLVMSLIFRVPYLIEGELEGHFKKIMESDNHLEIDNYISLMVRALREFALMSSPRVENNTQLRDFIEKVTNQLEDQTELLENLSKIVFAIQLSHQVDDPESSEKTVDERYDEWVRDELEVSISPIKREETQTKAINELSTPGKTLFSSKNSSINECIEKARTGDFPTIEEIKDGMMTENSSDARRIPHITDLTMLLTKERFPELDVDDETVERWKEHFVVQYPQLEQFKVLDMEKFLNDPITTNLNDNHENASQKIREKMNKRVIIQKEDMDKIRNYDTDNLDFVYSLINYIAERKHLGVSGLEIKKKFSSQTSLDLIDLLEFLCSIYVLLRAGTTAIHFVHYDYFSYWLIDSFKISPEEQSDLLSDETDDSDTIKARIERRVKPFEMEKIQLRPWLKLDGQFSEDICIDWLCTIVSKCCDSPNITFTKLSTHFWNLKPTDLFSLLEILQDLRCIEIRVYKKAETTLLSTRSAVADIGPATVLDNFEDMYVKTTQFCALSFGQVPIPTLT